MRPGKLSIIALLLIAGCTEEQAREFSRGYNESVERQREQTCDPGFERFAPLSPQAQQALIVSRRPKKSGGDRQFVCFT